MPKETLPPLERIEVVRIRNGARKLMALDSHWRVWSINHLRKDGQAPENRYCDGYLAEKDWPSLDNYSHFVPEREAQADPIRAQITQHQQAITRLEAALLEIYKEQE